MALSRTYWNKGLKPIKGRFFFKWINGSVKAPRGPYSGRPLKIGVWMSIPSNRTLSLCDRGFHFTKPQHIRHWQGQMLFKVEVKGERYYDYGGNKGLARHMRILYRVDPKTWRKQ